MYRRLQFKTLTLRGLVLSSEIQKTFLFLFWFSFSCTLIILCIKDLILIKRILVISINQYVNLAEGIKRLCEGFCWGKVRWLIICWTAVCFWTVLRTPSDLIASWLHYILHTIQSCKTLFFIQKNTKTICTPALSCVPQKYNQLILVSQASPSGPISELLTISSNGGVSHVPGR